MRLLRLLNYIRLLMLGIQRIFTMEEVKANMYSEVITWVLESTSE